MLSYNGIPSHLVYKQNNATVRCYFTRNVIILFLSRHRCCCSRLFTLHRCSTSQTGSGHPSGMLFNGSVHCYHFTLGIAKITASRQTKMLKKKCFCFGICAPRQCPAFHAISCQLAQKMVRNVSSQLIHWGSVSAHSLNIV